MERELEGIWKWECRCVGGDGDEGLEGEDGGGGEAVAQM